MTSHSTPPPVKTWRSKKALAGHYDVSPGTVDRRLRVGCPSMLRGGVRRFRLSGRPVALCLWHHQGGGLMARISPHAMTRAPLGPLATSRLPDAPT